MAANGRVRQAQEIENALLARIQTGQDVDGRLPSETDLAAQFGVSRVTVREALSALERQGLVIRKQGLGTFINRKTAEIQTRLEECVEYSELIRRAGYESGVAHLSFQKEAASEGLAERLLVEPGAPVLAIRKVFTANGRPVIYCINAIPLALVSPERGLALVKEIVPRLSIYSLLARWFDQRVMYQVAACDRQPGDRRDRPWVELSRGLPLAFDCRCRLQRSATTIVRRRLVLRPGQDPFSPRAQARLRGARLALVHGGIAMSEPEVFESLRTAILEGDEALSTHIAGQLSGDVPLLMQAVDVAIKTIKEVGERFGRGDCFLPEMVLAAESMLAFMKIATPLLEQATGKVRKAGKVVLGTVKGDIHTIGKDIVATMLSASGFEVVDLGVDVAPMDVIKAAESSSAQIIGLSALMTTSMPYQQETISLLNELKMRGRFWVIVGGGPVTSDYARRIGADGWAADAATAVRVCEQMLGNQGQPSGKSLIYEEKGR